MAEWNTRPSLLELFSVFLRVSALTIGGGYVMYPLMQREVVERKQWCSDEELIDSYALAQTVPGIIAMNSAALVGFRRRGLPGAAAAGLGMMLPSLLVILLIAAWLVACFDHVLVQRAFAGIRAAVVALMVLAVWKSGARTVRSAGRAAVAVVSFLLIAGWQVHPVLVIAGGGLAGALFFRSREVS